MVVKLREELSPQDLINFCASESSHNVVRICNMSKLWIERFPLVAKEFPKVLDFKNTENEEALKSEFKGLYTTCFINYALMH